MSISLGANGGSYNYPQENDPAGWGDDATNWASAVSAALSNIGLGGTASADAVVNIISTTKGVLIPRMTTTQRNAIGSPSTSLLIYNTTTTQYELYTGSTWQSLASYINGTLTVTGNTTLASVTGTNATFTGNTTFGDATSDTTAVTGILNVDSGVLYVNPTNNRVGINVTGPSQALEVSGSVQVSSQILAASGTSGTPSISFSGDSNSGFYSISDNVIGVATNGTRVGQIGVGYGGFTGNIIQVQNSTNTFYQAITTSGSYTDLNSASGIIWETAITPKYTSSKIIVVMNLHANIANSGGSWAGFNIYRKIGSGAYSSIYESNYDASGSYGIGGATNNSVANHWFYIINDSPSTISACTYKFGIRVRTTTTFYSNDYANASNPRNTSSIFLLELQQ